MISLLHYEFGQDGPLTVTRGQVHDYLGMTLDFSIPRKVQIQMYDFINKMLDDLPPTWMVPQEHQQQSTYLLSTLNQSP